jgi:2-keto-3-deoxy-L-rhamnonate aldolase RhmA
VATPGIDVAVIGPGDLATSIDKRGRADDPELLALMARAEAGIQAGFASEVPGNSYSIPASAALTVTRR